MIVADNGSTDDTAALIRTWPDARVRIVDAGRAPGVNVARNVGTEASRGRFILLTDCDDIVHDGWIEAHYRAFTGGAHAVGGGLDRILENGTLLTSSRHLFPALYRRNLFANGTNCGFTREAFDRVGGFDEEFMGGADEVDFFWRLADAGYRVIFVEGAVVSKVQHTGLHNAFTQYFNYGKGEALLINKVRPGWLSIVIPLVGINSSAWGLVWATSIARRTTVRAFAFNLGLLSESARLISARPPRQRLARLVQRTFLPRGPVDTPPPPPCGAATSGGGGRSTAQAARSE